MLINKICNRRKDALGILLKLRTFSINIGVLWEKLMFFGCLYSLWCEFGLTGKCVLEKNSRPDVGQTGDLIGSINIFGWAIHGKTEEGWEIEKKHIKVGLFWLFGRSYLSSRVGLCSWEKDWDVCWWWPLPFETKYRPCYLLLLNDPVIDHELFEIGSCPAVPLCLRGQRLVILHLTGITNFSWSSCSLVYLWLLRCFKFSLHFLNLSSMFFLRLSDYCW